MAFQRRIVHGLQEFKQWVNNTFSTKTHGHSDLSEAITAIQNEIKNLNPVNALPDFTRIYVISEPDNSYALNPGTIFKINVPGYILDISNDGTYVMSNTSSCDYFYKFASRPEYLYRRTDQATKCGGYDRPAYATDRCCLYGDVGGGFIRHSDYPILPGTSTYMTLCDASSSATTKLCFIPCRHVPTGIKQSDYVTPVARTENHLSTEGKIGDVSSLGSEIFTGNWLDNFNSNWSLKTSLVKTFDPGFRFVGNFWNNYRFHNLDPVKTGTDRMFWRYPNSTDGGTVVLKYVTSSEVDSIITGLTDAQKDTLWTNPGRTIQEQAELMADKWCIVHNTWPNQTAYNKVYHTYAIATDQGADAIFNGGTDTAHSGTGKSDLWYHTAHFYGNHHASIQKLNFATGYYIDPATGQDTTTKYAY